MLLDSDTSDGKCQLASSDLHCLHCNDQAIVCGVTTKDIVSSQPLNKMQIDDMERVLHTHRLRWHGHVERSDG